MLLPGKLCLLLHSQEYSFLSHAVDAGNATSRVSGVQDFTQLYRSVRCPQITDILMVKDGNVCEIRDSANLRYYDTYADTAQKMIDSFQIKW